MSGHVHQFKQEDFVEIEAEDPSGSIHKFSMDTSDIRNNILYQEKFINRVEEIIGSCFIKMQTWSYA